MPFRQHRRSRRRYQHTSFHASVAELTESGRAAIEAAQRAVTSDHGKALLKRRGELVERSFQHVLDCGAARRTTLRGRANSRKRYLIQAACANLSLLMRHLTGFGTPKQALAGSAEAAATILEAIFAILGLMRGARLAEPRDRGLFLAAIG